MGVRRRDAQVALHEGHQGGDVWLGSTIRACKGTTTLPVRITKLLFPLPVSMSEEEEEEEVEEDRPPVQLQARHSVQFRALLPVPRPMIRPRPGPTNPEDSRLERRRRDTRSLERGRRYLEATAAAWREWDEDRLRSEVDGLFLEGFVS